ncbi:glycosyltransferase family 2 protein [Endozoicomonas sp. GU-1]|uniref:glycosyltransferase family 2 protein n=1 Tax=Endozoicomonas sp. GU-1 TaxID=3009078 RepID=UPI0022B3F1CE|nr:glycosyltransferase family 2 protein [Endozoicomonas sp. GU-1]WBA84458.1 glycosyltransferase family 2 protein [Endozoicomonas sp. GU-1]
MKISVCLCTYKRAFLRNTLESLACQILPVDTTLEVIVVDNDQEKTAEKIIDDISRDYPFDIKYFSEPEKNIATARNKSIEMATGEWLAFIDDDEEADSNWISQLLNTAKKYQADFVQGPVIPIYPKSTPTWIKEGDYFGRRNLVTGTEIDCGAAGNGLLYSQWVKDGLRFNKEFGLTGGGKTVIFLSVYIKKEGD